MGDAPFCDGLGTQTAFDKMFAIMKEGEDALNDQTVLDPAETGAYYWLECHEGSDPFLDVVATCAEALSDFELNEPYRPNGELSLMHLFTPRCGGGQAECPGEWSVGGYSATNAVPTQTEMNIFLHESGHNLDASHHIAPTPPGCADGTEHGGQLRTSNFDIMSLVADTDKERVFTDGGNNNLDPNRDNLCFANANLNTRLGTSTTCSA